MVTGDAQLLLSRACQLRPVAGNAVIAVCVIAVTFTHSQQWPLMLSGCHHIIF